MTEDISTLMAKARDGELTSSEVTECVRWIVETNAPGYEPLIQTLHSGKTTLYLNRFQQGPDFLGDRVEDVLVKAHARLTGE
jgi:hypothetical protein